MKRRDFIAGAAALSMTSYAGRIGAAQEGSRANSQPSPKEALDRLVEGNRKYAEGKKLVFQLNEGRLAELEKGQRPFATIIGCSDSRVPVELVFDQDPGSLFVIRLAGNVIDPDVQGSLEYAAVHLATPLIVVMGHEKCGAVTAALAAQQQQAKELTGVRQLLEKVQPAIQDIDRDLPIDKQVALGVEANMRWSMKQIIEHADHRDAVKSGSVMVAGAVYELATGRVRFLKSQSSTERN